MAVKVRKMEKNRWKNNKRGSKKERERETKQKNLSRNERVYAPKKQISNSVFSLPPPPPSPPSPPTSLHFPLKILKLKSSRLNYLYYYVTIFFPVALKKNFPAIPSLPPTEAGKKRFFLFFFFGGKSTRFRFFFFFKLQ